MTVGWPIPLAHAHLTRALTRTEGRVVGAIILAQFQYDASNEPRPIPVSAADFEHFGMSRVWARRVLRRLEGDRVVYRVDEVAGDRAVRFFVTEDPERWNRPTRPGVTMTLERFAQMVQPNEAAPESSQ